MSLFGIGEIVSSAINSGTSAAETAATLAMNAKMQQDQRDWEEKQVDKQNEWNLAQWNREREASQSDWQRDREASLEDWNRENEYNDPSAVLERLRNAGINPSSVDAGGVQNSTSSPSLPTSSVPSGSPAARANGVTPPYVSNLGLASIVNNSMLMAKQREKIDAEIDNIKANTDELRETTPIKVKLLGQDLVLRDNADAREQERHIAELDNLQSVMKTRSEENDRAWQSLDVSKRGQWLSEQKHVFEKWLSEEQLSRKDKEIAVAMWNASISSRLATSKGKVDKAQIEYLKSAGYHLDAQGDLTCVQLRTARKDLETYDDRLRQSLRNQKVQNVSRLMDSGCNVVSALNDCVRTASFTGFGSTARVNSGGFSYNWSTPNYSH